MGLHHRKILEEVCSLYCQLKDSSCSSTDCLICIKHCYSEPPIDYLSPPSPPIYIDRDQDYDNPTKHHKIGTFLAVVIAVLTAAFFVLLCYAIYARFLSGYLRRRRRRTTTTSPETEDNPRGDFVDEEQGPMVDHPIWYIRTPGLQQSIISAITVCKYKTGEGLIEGTECSVCLSEFEEDENLRLLPKCNHAFHLPCIDTWLRSHTNCPMCRAPIVTNPATIVASPEPNVANLSNTEETEMEVIENGGENEENREEDRGREMVVEDKSESEGSGSGSGEELENLQPRRRSVSLDSSYVEKINRALAFAATNVASVESSASKRVSKTSSSSSFRIRSLQNVAGTSMKRSRSYNGKHLLACYGRGQRKPNLPIRSF